MSGFSYEERASDSAYIETITHGWSVGTGSVIRPAEIHWHLVFTRYHGSMHPIAVGALSTAGIVPYSEGAEILWIKFKLGTFMPHLPTKNLLDKEIALPGATSNSFWLNSSAWQFPDYENVETFVSRLAREGALARDTVVHAALQDQLHPEAIPSRTVRHRFLHATGLSQNHIRQYQRARQAAVLLQQGASILDTVYTAGYFDQPHLTRALRRFMGYTPAQIINQAG